MTPCTISASIGTSFNIPSARGGGSALYSDYDLTACDGSDGNGNPYPGGCYPLKDYRVVFGAIQNGDCDFTKWMQGKESVRTVTDALGNTFRIRFEPGGGFKSSPEKN